MIARHRIRVRVAPGLLVLLALLAAACARLSQPWGSVEVASGQPIRIGLLTDMDAGGAPALLQETSRAITVDGHELQIVPVPVHCAAPSAVATAPEDAALRGLSGVIGSGCSSACVYAESMLFETKTTLVASGCTAAAVVQSGYPIAFRLTWDDQDQALVAADYSRKVAHARRAIVVTDGSAYSRALMPAYDARFRARGGERPEQVEIPPSGEVDAEQLAREIEANGATAVFIAVARPDARALFAQLQTRLPGSTVIATDTVFLGDPGEAPPSGLVAVGLARRGGAWASELDAGPDSPDLFTAQAADALRIYAAAVGDVAKPQPDGSLLIPRQALRDALARTDMRGATGRIEFDAGGDRKHDVGAALYRLGAGLPVRVQVYER
jgi:branched-chain amino acid transport system substrate-binding protein